MPEIQAAFESRHHGPDDAQESLESFLAGNETPERFWETVGVNLNAGKLRLVFVADEIPSELRRIVEFLNEQMDETESSRSKSANTSSRERSTRETTAASPLSHG